MASPAAVAEAIFEVEREDALHHRGPGLAAVGLDHLGGAVGDSVGDERLGAHRHDPEGRTQQVRDLPGAGHRGVGRIQMTDARGIRGAVDQSGPPRGGVLKPGGRDHRRQLKRRARLSGGGEERETQWSRTKEVERGADGDQLRAGHRVDLDRRGAIEAPQAGGEAHQRALSQRRQRLGTVLGGVGHRQRGRLTDVEARDQHLAVIERLIIDLDEAVARGGRGGDELALGSPRGRSGSRAGAVADPDVAALHEQQLVSYRHQASDQGGGVVDPVGELLGAAHRAVGDPQLVGERLSQVGREEQQLVGDSRQLLGVAAAGARAEIDDQPSGVRVDDVEQLGAPEFILDHQHVRIRAGVDLEKGLVVCRGSWLDVLEQHRATAQRDRKEQREHRALTLAPFSDDAQRCRAANSSARPRPDGSPTTPPRCGDRRAASPRRS